MHVNILQIHLYDYEIKSTSFEIEWMSRIFVEIELNMFYQIWLNISHHYFQLDTAPPINRKPQSFISKVQFQFFKWCACRTYFLHEHKCVNMNSILVKVIYLIILEFLYKSEYQLTLGYLMDIIHSEWFLI